MGGPGFESSSASISSIPQQLPHHFQPPPPSRLLGQPLPALRIRIDDVSPKTFQSLLQYIYTGEIGLSSHQLAEIERYWNENAEDYKSLPSNRAQDGTEPEPQQETEDSWLNTPDILSPLGLSSQQQQQWSASTGIPQTASFSPPLYASQSQSQRLATTRRHRHDWQQHQQLMVRHGSSEPAGAQGLDPNSESNASSSSASQSQSQSPSQGQGQGQRREQDEYGGHETTSWEDLFLTARQFDLQDLQRHAMKATQYHCQMLNLRANFDGGLVAEVVHNGFDEPTLDLQLALEEHLLRSILRLYRCPRLKEDEDGHVRVEGMEDLRTHTEADVAVEGQEGEREKGEEQEEEQAKEEPSSSSSTRVVREHQEGHFIPASAAAGSWMPGPGLPQPVRSSIPSISVESWRNDVGPGGGSGDEEQEQEEDEKYEQEGSSSPPDSPSPEPEEEEEEEEGENAFEDAECQEALLELCTEIRERFVTMQQIMQGY
ncbi:hypothetical protein BGZ65_005562 [Modicella reniformis]|uniref:BTB domain-containing protein n=1 Tax=Modicella reniformis TaxID=1440133 RepID=A0A9P6MGV6_9FUNG|nr:hypothetical protein BGZ65_005562 [Modicella reniformis]